MNNYFEKKFLKRIVFSEYAKNYKNKWKIPENEHLLNILDWSQNIWILDELTKNNDEINVMKYEEKEIIINSGFKYYVLKWSDKYGRFFSDEKYNPFYKNI